MQLADILRERLDIENRDALENERTSTSVPCFGVRLPSMGLSYREVELVLGWLGVNRCHQAAWNWKETLTDAQSDPPTAEPSGVAVDEKQITVDYDEKWLYAAIDTESTLLLRPTCSAAVGLIPRRRFSIVSPRHTKSPTPSFSSMLVGI
jgi:hypothetical protein